MGAYLARRLIVFVPTLLVVSFLVFLMIHLVPGDPTALMLGQEATPGQHAILRRELGLDRSFPQQAVEWYGHALHGNLGQSFFLQQPVTDAVVNRLPVTGSLTLFSLLISTILGVAAGVFASTHHGRVGDWGLMLLAIVGLSVPIFWLALNMIFLFSVKLGWFPTSGYVPLSEDAGQYLRHLLLPSTVLGLAYTALIARMTRSSMLEVLRQDYVRTARSKGLRERMIISRHAFRNALIPIITVLGLAAGELLAGSVITETIFTLPGIGRLIVDAIKRRDYPLVQGGILAITLSYLFINLLVDLVYAWVDPRIHYS
ncbi:MAG: ABC transporter permease [Dehalococcoidia bacterium]